jgi:transposase
MAVTPAGPDAVVFIGIDVSSRDCYAAIEGKKPRRFKFDAASAASLAAWVREGHPTARLRAVMEHTGVYSMAWTALLKEHGVEYALRNAAKIHFHAIADGQRSKTDKADAKAILSYALHYRPEATILAPLAQRQLALLLKQRDSIIKQRVAFHNELKALSFLPENLALVLQERQ